MKKLTLSLLALAVALSLGLLVFDSPTSAGGRPLTAELSGAEEVDAEGNPNQGDLDGSGVMNLTLNSGQEEICFELTVTGIASPTRAHIHRGVAGQNGPVVVFFFDTVINPPIPVPEDLQGCVDVPRALVKEIRKNPSDFYINVHNDEFPAGAIRGQLSK